MPLSKGEVEAVLEPWHNAFWFSVENAFRRHMKKHESELAAIQERTKSSYINDIIVDNLRQCLIDMPNKEWESRYGAKRLWIEQICIRMKKFDRNLRPAVHPSQQAFKFATHTVAPPFQLRFPDNGVSPTCLFLGYITNATKTGPESLFIVCPKGMTLRGKSEIAWAYSIPKPEGMPAMPVTDTPPSDPLPIRVVTKVSARRNDIGKK